MKKEYKQEGLKIHKAKLKDRILMSLDRLKLKLIGKEWTPKSKDTEFCCIVCGKVHRNVIMFKRKKDSPMILMKGKKTAKKLYTLDFCSQKCINKYLPYAGLQLFDFNKMKKHLESGFWRKRWIRYYNWKQKHK